MKFYLFNVFLIFIAVFPTLAQDNAYRSSDNKNTMTIGKKVLGLILFSACIAWVFYGIYSAHKLKSNHILSIGYTTGEVTSNHGWLYMDFKYSVGTKNFRRSYSLNINKISLKDINENFLKRSFPIVYDSDEPSNAAMLITPEDFKRYGYDFPDSLTWVRLYIKYI